MADKEEKKHVGVVKKLFTKRQLDSRLEAILINPRLLGLPNARTLSFAMFIIILSVNLGLSIFLSEFFKQEVCTAENIFSDNLSANCEDISYTERFGFTFDSPSLALGSKAYLAVDIFENTEFDVSDILLSSDQLEQLREACSEPFSFPDNGPARFCLDELSFVTLEDKNKTVNSDLALRRRDKDRFYSIQVDDLNAIEVYFTFVNSPVNYIINAVLIMNKEIENDDGEFEEIAVAKLDITMLPEFVDDEVKVTGFNQILLSLLETIVSDSGRNEVFGVSLSTRFAKCCTNSGLNAFQYFGLLFDYTFILEGLMTVFCAIFILRCMGYQAYDSTGKIVKPKLGFIKTNGNVKKQEVVVAEVTEQSPIPVKPQPDVAVAKPEEKKRDDVVQNGDVAVSI